MKRFAIRVTGPNDRVSFLNHRDEPVDSLSEAVVCPFRSVMTTGFDELAERFAGLKLEVIEVAR